jgi:hypothetical protein
MPEFVRSVYRRVLEVCKPLGVDAVNSIKGEPLELLVVVAPDNGNECRVDLYAGVGTDTQAGTERTKRLDAALREALIRRPFKLDQEWEINTGLNCRSFRVAPLF